MARLDTETYRKKVLKDVESCLLDTRGQIDGFTSYGFYQALRSELNRADPETGLIDMPDDLCSAIDEAAERILHHMPHNRGLDLGAAH